MGIPCKSALQGEVIFRGNVDDCSLSRDYCAIVQLGKCRVVGLFDDFSVNIPLVDSVRQVAMLECMRIALRTDTDVLIYDFNTKSVLKSWPVQCSRIAAGFDHVIALTSDEKTVLCWGDGSRGQQGSGELARSDELTPVDALEEVAVVEIAAGGWHSTALSERGLVYQWGWNQHGQVEGPPPLDEPQRQPGSKAAGSKPNVVASPTLLQVSDKRVAAVACGSRHSLAIDETGQIRAWGWNDYGQCDVGNIDCQQKTSSTLFDAVAAADSSTSRLGSADGKKSAFPKMMANRQTAGEDQVMKPSLIHSIRAAFWTSAVQYSPE